MTAADRIAAPGVSVRGVGGSEIVFRYDLRALQRLEDQYGTLAVAAEALNTMMTALASDFGAPIMTDLAHHAVSATGRPDVLDVLDESAGEIAIALTRAWRQAWPDPDQAHAETTPKKAVRSRGSGSTGGRRSGSVAPTASSGG